VAKATLSYEKSYRRAEEVIKRAREMTKKHMEEGYIRPMPEGVE